MRPYVLCLHCSSSDRYAVGFLAARSCITTRNPQRRATRAPLEPTLVKELLQRPVKAAEGSYYHLASGVRNDMVLKVKNSFVPDGLVGWKGASCAEVANKFSFAPKHQRATCCPRRSKVFRPVKGTSVS
eukprot:TRINITY_DN39316_c0_g1_i1.p1 TRINITY_DN39316_c0_g1~~TRINITY_DN39316_c0_g1_i1.p1  ORF type:complete len:129 (-),score=3.32 TRINITY_DN39316_c0_g1_i1:341-727(-)